jgi:hypothetical protein
VGEKERTGGGERVRVEKEVPCSFVELGCRGSFFRSLDEDCCPRREEGATGVSIAKPDPRSSLRRTPAYSRVFATLKRGKRRKLADEI